jgi:hypothetical protein
MTVIPGPVRQSTSVGRIGRRRGRKRRTDGTSPRRIPALVWTKAAVHIAACHQHDTDIKPILTSHHSSRIEKTPITERLREERAPRGKEEMSAGEPLEGLPAGDGDGPDDSSDIYRGLAAETAAINTEFSIRLKNAPPGARRALKDQKRSALAAAKRRAKVAAAGRKQVRKDRRLRPVRRPRLKQKNLN